MKSKNPAAPSVDSGDLLTVLDEWKTAARKHREEQQRWESSYDFQRARRQELMAEIYDICAMEIRAVIARAECGCTNGIIRSLGCDNDEIIKDCPCCSTANLKDEPRRQNPPINHEPPAKNS